MPDERAAGWVGASGPSGGAGTGAPFVYRERRTPSRLGWGTQRARGRDGRSGMGTPISKGFARRGGVARKETRENMTAREEWQEWGTQEDRESETRGEARRTTRLL